MPCIQSLLLENEARKSKDPSGAPSHPENEDLYPPSALPVDLRLSGCIPGLAEKERRLRIGQADDALNAVRRQLRISSSIIEFKRGQHAATQRISRKTQSMLEVFKGKTARFADRYEAAYDALQSLDPDGEWAEQYQKLNRKKDLHFPRREEDVFVIRRRDRSENVRALSWIWLVPRLHVDAESDRPITAEEISDGESSKSLECRLVLIGYSAMRVEWANSKARADRWHEECRLVVEEMRRVIWYFDWKHLWWLEQCDRRTEVSPDLRQGLVAYAKKQAAIYSGLAHDFATCWYPYLKSKTHEINWPSSYLPTTPLTPFTTTKHVSRDDDEDSTHDQDSADSDRDMDMDVSFD